MAARNRSDTDSVRRPPAANRRRRRLDRYRGMLRCEWCGRMAEVDSMQHWSHLPTSEWERFVNANKVWFCSRPRCVSNRAELRLPGDDHARDTRSRSDHGAGPTAV
jgi:hypothetical protein